MFTTTVILPAATANWEVWRCGNGSGSVWQGSADDPVQGANGSRSVVIALPARSCRTFAFSAPTEDRQLLRKLAFAQLEKRGLTTAGVEQTAFECHVMSQGGGHSLVSVDVVTPEAAATINGSKARALLPSARLFHIPEGKLVVVEEQGRLVLCAGTAGRLIHSQIVSATRDLNGHAAPEIRIASLALQQQGVLPEVSGIELWGDFSAGDAQELSAQLSLPVQAKARPAPDSPAVRREATAQLLSPAARQRLRRRQLGLLRWVALAALVVPVLWWLGHEHKKLTDLEAEANRIETTLNIPTAGTGSGADQARIRAENEIVTAAQARWAALRMALEPRRYPVAILDGFSRCLTAADVVLTRFESKAVDLSVSGTARSAKDAYTYFNAISKDGPLGVYAWSMIQPTIAADGSAAFEIKGEDAMKRLTKSEKTLFALCLAVLVLVGGFFAWRNHRNRMTAAQDRIENLQSRYTAAVAASGDAPFWKERQAWLDATMPAMGDSGQAHSTFLEHLQSTARQRGLIVTAPVLLKPEGGPHFRDLSISLTVTGPDGALFRWLADLQSPEKFQLVEYLLLTPATVQPPRMTCSLTIARLYKP